MRTRFLTKVVGACLAALALVAAYYFFSLGVLFESACHKGDAAACADLARTLRLSFVLALVSAVVGVITGATVLRDARRGRSHGTR